MSRAVDDLIDELAARQLGLVTRTQLRERGITEAAIDRRVHTKRIRLMHRGVYRVGPLVAPRVRELAAVLACGPHAVLSHRSAGALWQMLPDPDKSAPIDVSMGAGDRGRVPGIRVHRVSLQPDDVTSLANIPITTPARTLFDLAPLVSGRELERALAHAEKLQRIDRRGLSALAARRAGRPGARLMRALLQSDAAPALTRSEAEEQFLALIRRAQLPAPETNVRVGDYEVDFLWRRARLVVEVDGYAFHSSKQQFESDRRRDAQLTASGLSVMRVTWQQVVHEREAMLVRLAQSLARPGIDFGP